MPKYTNGIKILKRWLPWLLGTAVDVSIVLWKQVDVVEDGASPVAVGHRLLEANIEKHRPVEQVAVRLVHHIDPIMQLLPPSREPK